MIHTCPKFNDFVSAAKAPNSTLQKTGLKVYHIHNAFIYKQSQFNTQ